MIRVGTVTDPVEPSVAFESGAEVHINYNLVSALAAGDVVVVYTDARTTRSMTTTILGKLVTKP